MQKNKMLVRAVAVLGAVVGCVVALWASRAFAASSAMAGATSSLGTAWYAIASPASFFNSLFESDYMPRSMCMYGQGDVIWTHLISDSIVAAAYYSIPIALVYFIRKRRDLAFNWLFYFFAAFILACGTTHVFSVIAIWHPFYRLDGIIKAVTALISIATAIVMWPLIPKALLIPSPRQLQLANDRLAGEVAERTRAEEDLRRLTGDLEQRVQQRTTELGRINVTLREEIEARQGAERDQAQLAAIVESSADAIVGMDMQGIVATWNAGAERLFGYSPAEIVGHSITKLLPVERGVEETAILDKIRRGERIEHMETTRLTKDGRMIAVSVTVSPIKDHTGQIIGASKISRDITDRKAAEAEREELLRNERAARADAERANKVKDEFLATLSHELRTPMNAILGWTHLLREGRTTAPEDLHQGLEVIDRNTRVQVQLIEDLLDMSRIISGKLRLDVRQVHPIEVVEAAIETIRPAAQAKTIKLTAVLDPLAGPISGDPSRLQQVVWNLLTNAVKFTPKGGQVQVHLERVNSHIEIVVSDTGQGIAPEFLPHVFERFRQGDSSTTRKHGGLGIGLAIARQLVELHGGSIRVQSRGLGQGATFFVALPCTAVQDSRDAAERVHPTAETVPSDFRLPCLAGLKVLIVDDERDTRELLGRFLTDSGAVVQLAGSTREALELIRRDPPAVLVSDIGMPEEDGYALIRQVRAQEKGPGGRIPAVALTAFARSEDRMKALLSGFQMHLAKPVEPAEFITVIANVAGVALKSAAD